MSIDPTRNFAKIRVSTTYNNSATSIVLNTGDGAKLPDPSTNGAFNLTWFNSTNYPDPSDDPLVEIVRVTSRSGDTLTIVRGQENTTASNKNTASVTYIMILAPTKKTIDELQKFSIATDQTDFASQSFQNILRNGSFESWSSGITSAPDGWSAGSGTTMIADSTNKKMGTYGASITSPNAAQGYIYQSIPDLTYFKGRAITLGGWVKTSTSIRVCIYIQDGISYALSPYHTGSGNWELLTIPFAVSNSATELTVFCMVYIAGTPVTAYFDGMILVEGSIVPAFSPRPLYDDAKTLQIDSLNNRVGIKNATPSQALDIIGNIAVTGTVDDVDISAIPSTYVAKAGDTMTGALAASTELIRKTTRGRFGLQRIVSNKPARIAMTAGAWTARTAPNVQRWESIAWSPELGLFAAVADTGAVAEQIITSPDGNTWTARTSPYAQIWISVVWSPELGLFVAVAANGGVAAQIMTSADGITWTARTSPYAQQWRSVVWSPELGLFAAVALDGIASRQIMTSPDGITWTARTSPNAQQWRSVAWSPELGLFAAVAANGTVAVQIMTSPDGITWTARTSPDAQAWLSIAWSPELGLFAAVAYDGVVAAQIMTSADGITWTARTSPNAQQWTSVVWSPELGLFAAVASNGTVAVQIMTSQNGIIWTARTSTNVQAWLSIAWSPELGLFASAGGNGVTASQIMTSFPVATKSYVRKTGDTMTGALLLGTNQLSGSNVAITGGAISGITDLAVADGGTGASDAATARTNLGLAASGAGDIWVEKTGDTMTGSLNVGKGQIIYDIAALYLKQADQGAESYALIQNADGSTILNTASGKTINFRVGDSSKVTIDTYGQVGIGAAPSHPLDINKTLIGSQVDVRIQNSDNTNAASDAQLAIRTGGVSGGDPKINFAVSGVIDWYLGIDNSDSEKLKINYGGAGVSDGTNVVTINSQNVGIGTTAPGFPLTVDGSVAIKSATARDFYLYSSGTMTAYSDIHNPGVDGDAQLSLNTGGGEAIRILHNKNVGIGTATPLFLLDVAGTIRSGTTTGGRVFLSSLDSPNYAGAIYLTNDVSTTQKSVRLNASYASGGGAGYANFNIARSTNSQAYNLDPSALTYAVALTIDGSNGSVGIGTETPSGKFTIQSSGDGEQFSIKSSYSGNNKIIEATQESSDGMLYVRNASGITNVKLSGYINTPSYFNGNVGIGITAPSAKVQIAGSTVIHGDASANSRKIYIQPTVAGDQSIYTDYSGSGGDSKLILGSYANRTNQLVLDTTGNVGIGIVSPNARLSIVAPSASEIAGTSKSSVLLSSAGSLGTTSGNELFLASIGCRTSNSSSLGIRAIRTANGTSYDTTAIGLNYCIDNDSSRAGMWFHANGYIGIGTTSPVVKLDISGTMGYPATTGTTDTGILQIHDGASNHVLNIGTADISPWGSWLQAQDTTVLSINYPLLLNPNGGNVGIGTTTPSQRLTVVGDASIGDGGTTNYRKIDATGAMTMEGTAQPLAELQYLMGTEGFGVRTPATNGANMATIGDSNGEIGAAQFAGAATNYLDISFKIPGNYEQNTNVYIELLWRTSATSGNCYWGIAYSAVAADEVTNPSLSAFTTGTFLTSTTTLARNNHMITLISPTIDPEDFVTLRIERLGADGSDTINAAIDLLMVNVQFGVNS